MGLWEVRALPPRRGELLRGSGKRCALTDAGLTPYHANRRSWPKLPPGVTAVVIGTGRLGHLAIQILNAAAATVIAVDTRTEALDLALKKQRRPCQPEVLNPGARGLLRPDIVQFSLEQAMDAYRQMQDRKLTGRVVIVPSQHQ